MSSTWAVHHHAASSGVPSAVCTSIRHSPRASMPKPTVCGVLTSTSGITPGMSSSKPSLL